VAKVFLPEADFPNLARRILLDLRHPALPSCPNENAGARRAEAFWRGAVRGAAEAMLKRAGIQPDELCRPPKPADESCRAFCPRCGAQFTSTAGRCADCGGLELVGFNAR